MRELATMQATNPYPLSRMIQNTTGTVNAPSAAGNDLNPIYGTLLSM